MDFDEFDFDDKLDDNPEETENQFENFDIHENEVQHLNICLYKLQFMPDLLNKNDAVLFLVDCNEQIFKSQYEENIKRKQFNKDELKKEDNQDQQNTQFSVVMKSIQSFFKSKIIGSPEDLVGVIFYNVKNTNNELGYPGINVVYQLNSPTATIIRNIIKIKDNFEKDYGFNNNTTPFNEVLFLCLSIFSKLIFLFTNNDDPHQKNKDEYYEKYEWITKSLVENDIEIELFPLATKDRKFNMRKFYDRIIAFDIDEVNESIIDTSDKVLDIQNRLRQKQFKKRAVNHLLFTLGEDTQLGIRLYCPFIRQKRPAAKLFDSDQNKYLKRVVKHICKETGQSLYQNQISTCVNIGGEKVAVSKEDIAEIKASEEPGMRLIGFKSTQSLKPYHNYRTSYFVYPDENHVKGSSQAFDALISQMVDLDKIAIVRFLPRKGTSVRFCALLPQEETYDDNHTQTPPGFHLIFLPYTDDLRNLGSVRPQQKVEVSRNLINSAKILCNALELQNFDFRNFEDPSLQKFFAHLQAHALQEDNPDNPPDLLLPDEEGMKRCEEVFQLFEDILKIELNEEDGNEIIQNKKKPRKSKKVTNQPIIEKKSKEKKKNSMKKTISSKKREIKKEEDVQDEQDIDEFTSLDSQNDFEEQEKKLKKKGIQKKRQAATNKKQNKNNQPGDTDLSFEEENKQLNKNEKLFEHVEQNLNEKQNNQELSIDELKQYLKHKGLKHTGNKKEFLIEIILKHLNKN